MRTVFALAAGMALSLVAGTVSAQGLDWTGFYGGVLGATHDGTHEYDNSGSTDYDLEGPAFGVFGGYQWANGNLVYGAELAASRGGVYEVSTDGVDSYKDEYEYTRFFDVKGRLGYGMNNVLVYGTLGLSRANWVSDTTTEMSANGTVMGVGADYQVNDRFFVGAEYLRRTYDFNDFNQSSDIDAKINSLGLRLGMKF